MATSEIVSIIQGEYRHTTESAGERSSFLSLTVTARYCVKMDKQGPLGLGKSYECGGELLLPVESEYTLIGLCHAEARK